MDPASDPRPDLFIDSEHWSRLLPAALLRFGTDPEGPFWVLQGMRCMGGNIELRDGVARLRRGWIDADRYEVIREEWLRPHLAALRPLLEDPQWAR